ncbi:MAG: hypothetical protein LBD50_02775 [Rickettsiales bacterium]|nr:hypothetical protein [Rickettsiales bacterium]
MPRQIQIRRGTAAQHENFTGAAGEITMDTTDKTLRVHDGATAGGIPLARRDEIPEDAALPEDYDFVIESGGTSEAWYRKYKSGWVEQGGSVLLSAGGNIALTLPIEMADAAYFVNVASTDPNGTWSGRVATTIRTAAVLTIYNTGGSGNQAYCWGVKGMAA